MTDPTTRTEPTTGDPAPTGPDHHRVVVVGAGLGGLVAAAVLHRRGTPALVLDLEADRHARTQGGMLDIHDDTGQQALRAAGLHEAFLRLVHPGGEAMRILDRHATVLRDEQDPGGLSRPEVDRGQLRDLLLDALPAGAVRWGSKVVDVHPVPGSAAHRVRLADGSSLTTDLLVGADGAWSRVRPLVSTAVPAYSGISFVEADLLDAERRHPAQARAMGDGMLFALGGSTGILGHREPDGSLHVYLGHRADESWLDTIDFGREEASKAAVAGLLDGWDDALRGLVLEADGPLVPRRIHALPSDHAWERVPGVTLLGDAAHVMSPFAGEGANLALADGADLALALAAHSGDTEAALAAYEATLFARSSAAATDSAESLEMIFAPDAPEGLVAMFEAFEQDAAGEHTGRPEPSAA